MPEIDFKNGKFGVGCKADKFFVTQVRIESAPGETAIIRDMSMEDAKAVYFDHAHKCTGLHDGFWIYYCEPGGTWKPIKRNKEGGFSVD